MSLYRTITLDEMRDIIFIFRFLLETSWSVDIENQYFASVTGIRAEITSLLTAPVSGVERAGPIFWLN
jgi:hypothetical protein